MLVGGQTKRATVTVGPPLNGLQRAAQRVARTGTVMIVGISLCLVALICRVVQLQVRPSKPIRALIGSQSSLQPLGARRGGLFDRHGRVLATSRIAHVLFVDPHLIEDPNTFSEDLGYALGYDPAWLEQKIAARADRRWVPIDQELSDKRLHQLKRVPSGAAATQLRLDRDYPKGHLAGQLIGFVGQAGDGLDGLEWALNGELSGANGSLKYVRDARRRALWVSEKHYHAPANGRSVRLTVDVTIQAIAEQALKQTCTQFGAPSGQIVVLSATDGDILAMANYPFFDPNQLAQSPPAQRRNRCVTDPFEPGSIFKPFIWSAAIDSRLLRHDQMIDCTDGGFYVSPKGRRLHDTRGHGRITFESVLVLSSNIGMAIAGQRLGPDRLFDALRRFSFGQPTHCGLPGEARGIVNPRRRWNHYSVTSIPMGQEIATTPIQLVRAFSVFANDGLMVKPRIRMAQQSTAASAIYKRVLSKETAQLTRRVLRRVVTDGTGARANSSQYTIFGKTGTAQIADRARGGYLQGQYVASFVCAAPLERTRVVVGCFVHRPDRSKGYYGGTVAAPAARSVVEQTLAYLGVPPDYNDTSGSSQFVRR